MRLQLKQIVTNDTKMFKELRRLIYLFEESCKNFTKDCDNLFHVHGGKHEGNRNEKAAIEPAVLSSVAIVLVVAVTPSRRLGYARSGVSVRSSARGVVVALTVRRGSSGSVKTSGCAKFLPGLVLIGDAKDAQLVGH